MDSSATPTTLGALVNLRPAAGLIALSMDEQPSIVNPVYENAPHLWMCLEGPRASDGRFRYLPFRTFPIGWGENDAMPRPPNHWVNGNPSDRMRRGRLDLSTFVWLSSDEVSEQVGLWDYFEASTRPVLAPAGVDSLRRAFERSRR